MVVTIKSQHFMLYFSLFNKNNFLLTCLNIVQTFYDSSFLRYDNFCISLSPTGKHSFGLILMAKNFWYVEPQQNLFIKHNYLHDVIGVLTALLSVHQVSVWNASNLQMR